MSPNSRGEAGRLGLCRDAIGAKFGDQQRNNSNDNGRVYQDRLGRRTRHPIQVRVVGVLMLFRGYSVPTNRVDMAVIVVVGDTHHAVLGRVMMRQAVTRLRKEERHS